VNDTTNTAGVTAALVRRELSWPELLGLMRAPKEPTRFDETIVAHQQLVDWDEQILLPLGENLYIVAKDGRRGDQLVAVEIDVPADDAELQRFAESWNGGGNPRSALGV